MKNLRSTSRRPELLLDLIALDRKSHEPLHRQLYLRLVELIMDGSLPFDGRLPSSRALAQKINVSRNTVVSAYQQLEVEGYVQAQRGSQTFVAAAPNRSTTRRIEEPTGAKDPLSKRGRQMISQPMNFFGLAHRRSLQPGIPDVTHFPFVTLRRIIAHRLQAGGDYVFGYQHIAGYPPLKQAIARYLAAARGVRCEPDQVVITNGAQPAFDLLARILTDPEDCVWMEDPGYPAAQSAFVAAGATIMPLPVSMEGWELSTPPEDRLRAIYVTPSCQSPLGVTMRLEQRLRLAEIARAQDAWIIEDDFDGEYRFSGNAVPALQGVAADSRTIYVGTFSKTMFPSLRIGYVILPLNMVANISQAMFLTGQYASGILQAALADFIEEGHFTTHLGRMRRLYRQAPRRLHDLLSVRTRRMARAQRPRILAFSRSGIAAPGVDDVEITLRARENGVVVTPLSLHYRQSSPRHGLILGYTALERPALQAELKTLRRIFRRSDDETLSETLQRAGIVDR